MSLKRRLASADFVPADSSSGLGAGLVLAQDFTARHVDDRVDVSLRHGGFADDLVLPHVCLPVMMPGHASVPGGRARRSPHRTPSPWGWTTTGSYCLRSGWRLVTGQPLSWGRNDVGQLNTRE